MNPMFNALGPMNNFQRMMQAYQQFQASFHGDAKAEVEKILQSGRINQQQLDQVQNMARQLMQQFMQFMK